MSDEFIMQMRPLFGDEEKKAVSDYMDEDGFLTEFKRTEQFEKMIADYTGAKHCIVTNNGTISLTLAAMAVGIEALDEVIIPNYTMIATPNSVRIFGAKPVFVDVEPETLCADLSCIKNAISKKTKAIMLVSANGRFPKSGISELENLCKENNIVLIEDSAQSLGSYYPDGRHIGTAGLVGSFSFSAPKIISTGQGGAIVTNDDFVAEKLRRLKDFGRLGGGNDTHDHVGFNFKFTELQACVGIEQIKKLPARVVRKKEIYRQYKDGLSDIEEIKLFSNDLELTSPWFYDTLCENRENLMEFLKNRGIGSRIMYPPVNKQKIYFSEKNYPISNLIGAKGLWLPSSVQMTDQQIDKVIAEIRNFYRQ
jgi:perosamine synthetase